MRPTSVLVSVTLVALVAAPFVAAQAPQPFPQCGSVTLIFMNPDLRPRDDGFVHASGTFFIQFQAIGDTAADVAKIAFSFGKPLPDEVAQCEGGPTGPFTGLYAQNYRSDSSAADGFFVPVNTTLVPDGEYGAALDAFDASGALMGHLYTKAIVENGANCFPRAEDCDDHTAPWPMILPGDGEQTNEGGGITIEFAEFVSDVLVRVNGEQVVPDAWAVPPRDDDAQPDNDAEDCAGLQDTTDQLPLGNNYLCHRVVWGSGFRIARATEAGDVIEVRAIDLAGNEATKVVNVGGVTQGGGIALQTPELTLTSDVTDQEAQVTSPAEFNLKLVNVGKGDAEARMTLQAPGNLTIEWGSPTVTVPAGGEQVVSLKATPTKELKPGEYTLLAKATYKSGTDDVTKQLALHLRVSESRQVPDSPLRQTRVNQSELPPEDAPAKGTPGLEPLAMVGALALVAVVERRRRGP
jgi:hypothetical protein